MKERNELLCDLPCNVLNACTPVHTRDLCVERPGAFGRHREHIHKCPDESLYNIMEWQSFSVFQGLVESGSFSSKVVFDKSRDESRLVREVLIECANRHASSLGDPCRGQVVVAVRR